MIQPIPIITPIPMYHSDGGSTKINTLTTLGVFSVLILSVVFLIDFGWAVSHPIIGYMGIETFQSTISVGHYLIALGILFGICILGLLLVEASK